MQESERIFIAENATLLRGSERELNRQLFTILNSIYDGLYITDGQANTILINRAYEEVSACGGRTCWAKACRRLSLPA